MFAKNCVVTVEFLLAYRRKKMTTSTGDYFWGAEFHVINI